jgi:hypothetical protein
MPAFFIDRMILSERNSSSRPDRFVILSIILSPFSFRTFRFRFRRRSPIPWDTLFFHFRETTQSFAEAGGKRALFESLSGRRSCLAALQTRTIFA